MAGQPAAAQPLCRRCHPVHDPGEEDCTGCHRGNPDTARQDLAHFRLLRARFAAFTRPDSPTTEAGNQLLERLACRRCHQIGGTGDPLASDLDQRARTADPEALAEVLRRPVLQMPDFHLQEEQVVAVVNALLRFGRDASPPTEEVPLKVHFAPDGAREDPFEKHCGGCHRVLTATGSGQGEGDTGPNLSGLLGPYYPPTAPGGRRWTRDDLRRWLENPRQLRPDASMPPVPLEPAERDALLDRLRHPEELPSPPP